MFVVYLAGDGELEHALRRRNGDGAVALLRPAALQSPGEADAREDTHAEPGLEAARIHPCHPRESERAHQAIDLPKIAKQRQAQPRRAAKSMLSLRDLKMRLYGLACGLGADAPARAACAGWGRTT